MKSNIMKDDKGFSLVELIIVVAIMAVLMGVFVPTLIGHVEKSRESTDLHNIATVRRAIEDAMADDKVYDEVMDKISGTKLVIDLGETKDAGFDGSGLNNYSKLQKKLKDIIPTDIDIKSPAALASGNHLLVEIGVDGNIAVYIGSSATAESSDAIPCAKSTNADGSQKLFLISK